MSNTLLQKWPFSALTHVFMYVLVRGCVRTWGIGVCAPACVIVRACVCLHVRAPVDRACLLCACMCPYVPLHELACLWVRGRAGMYVPAPLHTLCACVFVLACVFVCYGCVRVYVQCVCMAQN